MPEISESKYLVSAWHAPNRTKTCIRCHVVLPVSSFASYPYVTNQGKASVRYESRCRPCNAARRMERYAVKGTEDRATSRAWKDRNQQQVADYNAKRQKDPHHRRNKAKAQRLRKARMRSGQSDDAEIRAIYAEALRIEQQIAQCPLFALPELGYKMHVDHVRPLARGGLHVASNLQILPAGINMRKGVTCPK